MIPSPTTLLALALAPALAFAQSQQFEGLDLTTQPEKVEQKDQKEEPPPDPAEAPSVDTSSADTAAQQLGKRSDTLERDITQEDRVKSVHRKVYLKKGRFELNPVVSITLNDPYYAKYGFGGRLAYYFADNLALAGRFTWIELDQSRDTRIAKATFQSRIFFSNPQWSAMADLEWSPLNGKVAFFNSILHFDGYLIGGLGAIYTETSKLPNIGPHVGADVGIGMRFVAKDFLAVSASLINTTYVDQPAGTTKGSVQNMLALGFGVSVFIPFHSTGRESE